MFVMFMKYNRKDQKKFLIYKGIILVLILLMAYAAIKLSKLNLPTLKEQVSFGIGVIMIILVVVLALFNRIKSLLKIKSLGFVYAFIALLLLSFAIETLVIGVGLITIPLLIDDLLVNNYFRYLNVTKYWDYYKDVVKRDG